MGSAEGSLLVGAMREVVAQPLMMSNIPAEAANRGRRRIRMLGLPSRRVGDRRFAAVGNHPS
jgi:hypothetical protein